MTTDRETLAIIGSWMEDGRTRLPDHVLDAVIDQLPSTPQHRSRWFGWSAPGIPRMSVAMLSVTAVAIAAIAVVGLTLMSQVAVGPAASPTATPSPVSGRTACKTSVAVTGTILGCSRDAARLLIQRDEKLLVLDVDGAERQVAELSGFSEFLGSSRPTGATISPDGSRVVFAGVTRPNHLRSCHDGAVFAVDADGGAAELLFASRIAQNGIVRDPMFSPDGTRIAFVDGYCDSDHSVWVMNANGTAAQQIVTDDHTPLGATHIHGLAWSPAGDRIAVKTDQGIYSFAPDGSGTTTSEDTSEFCWPGWRC